MSQMDQPKKQALTRWMGIGWIIVFFVASFAGLAHQITRTIEKVAAGEGAETYRTVWLVEFNYIGLLVLVGAFVLALIVGTIMQLREWWLVRDLEKKYGNRNSDI